MKKHIQKKTKNTYGRSLLAGHVSSVTAIRAYVVPEDAIKLSQLTGHASADAIERVYARGQKESKGRT